MKPPSLREMSSAQSFLLLLLTLLLVLDSRHQSADATSYARCRTNFAMQSAECYGCTKKNLIWKLIRKLTVLADYCSEFMLLGLMPSHFNSLFQLETLVITENVKAPQLRMPFNFGRLKYIDLSNNGFVSMETRFPRTTVKLNLSNNRISFLGASTFTGMNDLETLDLSGNPFQIIENGVFDHFPAIHEIRLNGANLSYPPDKLFQNVPTLKRLYISGSHVNFFPHGIMNRTSLDFLDVSHNNLLRFPVWVLREADKPPKVLNLSGNRIWEIWDVKEMNIDVLDLSGNPLASVHPGAFLRSRITQLNLTGTSLSILPDSMDTALRAADTIVNLSGMKTACNCSMLWLSKFLQETDKSQGPKCDEHSAYSGLKLSDISSMLSTSCPHGNRWTHAAERGFSESHLGTANLAHLFLVAAILTFAALTFPMMCWVTCCMKKRTAGGDKEGW